MNRTTPPSASAQLAILIAGPSGVGKSTVCLELRQDLHIATGCDVGYINGDSFAHLSFPWRADATQLNLKYLGIHAAIEIVRDAYRIVLIEDTFRRQIDIDRLRKYLSSVRIPLAIVFLTASLSTLKTRNGIREWPHKVSDARVEDLFEINKTLVWGEHHVIQGEMSAENVREAVMQWIRSRLPSL